MFCSGDLAIPSLGPRKVKNFEDLEVWKAADRLAHDVFRITQGFPRTYLYDLSNQLRRAALSVPANIAEGSASLHSKELIQSLNVARRSLAEMRYFLLFARDEGLIASDPYELMIARCESIGRMLSGLIRSVRARKSS
jgi:four helix bundle protein